MSPLTLKGIGLALEAPLLGRLVGEAVRAHGELVELRARDLPLVGDHLGRDALGHELVALQQLLRPRAADVVDPLEADAHRDVAHVLDPAADHDVVHAGGDQRRAEVDRLLGRAALAVDRGGRRLHRQAGLQPGVAADVEHLLAVLLHAAADDILDLAGVDPRPLDHLGVGRSEQLVRVRVPVVALLGMAAPDGRADRLDDDDFAPVAVHSTAPPFVGMWQSLRR